MWAAQLWNGNAICGISKALLSSVVTALPDDGSNEVVMGVYCMASSTVRCLTIFPFCGRRGMVTSMVSPQSISTERSRNGGRNGGHR